MTAPRRVSVAILSWNGRRHLASCLGALAEQRDPGVPWEVLVLDNGSTDGTAAWVRAHYPAAGEPPAAARADDGATGTVDGRAVDAAAAGVGAVGAGAAGAVAAGRGDGAAAGGLAVRLIESPVNLGFCGGNNRLIAEATGDAVAFLNNDTRPCRDWLAALVAALAAAPDDVAAVSGKIVDWQGENLDFGRGVMAFDGHAFQLDFRRPLAAARVPAAGEELLFACGGNMLIRRESFLAAGGFDESYFAYLEDVDLGWRLWSGGERVTFVPDAVVHHRSSATSDLLGLYNRGFLFERNAFLTAYKNYEEGLWQQVMPALLLTFLSRTQTMLADNNPGGGSLRIDPYAGWIANTAPAPSAAGSAASGVPAGGGAVGAAGVAVVAAVEGAGAAGLSAAVEDAGAAGLSAAGGGPGAAGLPAAAARRPPALVRAVGTLRQHGAGELWRRLARRLRALLPRRAATAGGAAGAPPAVVLTDERTVAQLRALSYLLSHLEAAAAARQAVQRRRRRSDREIFARFPLYLVPTYPGDEWLFASPGFNAWLPADLPLARHTLGEVMELGG